MEAIATLLAVIIGWGLSEGGKIYSDKRLDKRKLKKVLFYLLELRYHFAKELSLEADFETYTSKVKIKFADKLKLSDEDIDQEMSIWMPIVKELVSKSLNQNNRLEFLEDNIDNMLNDLSEVFPIFAYELSGQHNIKSRLNSVENYLNEIEVYGFDHPFDIKEWIQPKLTSELLTNIDKSIKKISKKIDRKTQKEAQEKISKMTFDRKDSSKDDKLLNELLQQYLNLNKPATNSSL